MHEIERQFKKKESTISESTEHLKYKTIWFNPWKYDGREDVRNALIQTILRSIINDDEIKNDSSRKKEWIQLARRFGWCATGISMQLASAAIQATINVDAKEIAARITEESKVYFPGEGLERLGIPISYDRSIPGIFQSTTTNPTPLRVAASANRVSSVASGNSNRSANSK